MQNFEERADRAKRFAQIWWKSRSQSGKSQEYLAMSVGVSKRTIQNWEKGTSFPDLFQSTEWFRALGLNPLPYYLEYLYPEICECDSTDDKTEEALIQLVKQCTPFEKKELLFLMSGKHGSSWYSLLQMMTAHCHISLQSRVMAARIVAENYDIEKETDKLVCVDSVQPNIEILNKAIREGKVSAEQKKTGYTNQ